MQQLEVINILKKDLNFTDQSIEKLKEFTKMVLKQTIFKINLSLFSRQVQEYPSQKYLLQQKKLR